jgi:IS1 family transposase
MVGMNRLSAQQRARIVRAVVEGNSIRATGRMTGAAKNTVVKLLVDLGTACEAYQDRAMRDLPCRRLRCDEIWSFCWAKEKHVPPEHQGQFGSGDVWTWTAIDADTKLVPTWWVGRRTADDAAAFIGDLAGRLANRVQVTTDGHRVYLTAVAGAFGDRIDYAQLVELYGPDPEGETRYRPPACIGTETHVVAGEPDPVHVSTSYAERQNLTLRMGMRRFTRLTNAFSTKVANLAHAVALHFMHYNFARPHQTLKTTPAMAAGVADHPWTIEEIVGLLDSN